jgi:2-polyprenyl-6-methoxyphenol hydroxylase-like FAD-dependent oxidoreductase
MMVGVLGAWRLGWRLALAVEGLADPEGLLEGYEREQRAASEEIQNANALIFRNMAVANRLVGTARGMALRGISHVGLIVRRMTEKEALVTQELLAPGGAPSHETQKVAG